MPTVKSKPGRILVIEDDWDILEVLKLMLEYEGHQVTTAKHGKAALAAAAARPFDLVVMDISMPEMSGIEVAQALRANAKTADVYIVIHTGLDEPWVRDRFADYDVFLTKAANATALVDEIARLLDRPKGPRQTRAMVAATMFSSDDTLLAQRALRQAMGLGPDAIPAPAFVAGLASEIRQMRQIGHSDAEIAAIIGTAVGKDVPAALLFDVVKAVLPRLR